MPNPGCASIFNLIVPFKIIIKIGKHSDTLSQAAYPHLNAIPLNVERILVLSCEQRCRAESTKGEKSSILEVRQQTTYEGIFD